MTRKTEDDDFEANPDEYITPGSLADVTYTAGVTVPLGQVSALVDKENSCIPSSSEPQSLASSHSATSGSASLASEAACDECGFTATDHVNANSFPHCRDRQACRARLRAPSPNQSTPSDTSTDKTPDAP